MQGISVFLLVIFVLFVVQAVGGYFQVKDYRRAVRRVHQLGNVGIGQKKGRFLSGNIYEHLDVFRGMDKKKRKYYKGYIRALEALDMRLQGATL